MKSLAVALTFAVNALAADGSPANDAERIVNQFQKRAIAAHEKAETELKPARDEAVSKLKAIQDAFTREAKLDEALAVRELIRSLLGVRPDPGTVRLTADDIGKTMIFDLTGAVTGSVWGAEVFTADSNLAAAAVHAGILKPGQRGLVRVRVLGAQTKFAASLKNGVQSTEYGAWPVSFTVEPGPALPK